MAGIVLVTALVCVMAGCMDGQATTSGTTNTGTNTNTSTNTSGSTGSTASPNAVPTNANSSPAPASTSSPAAITTPSTTPTTDAETQLPTNSTKPAPTSYAKEADAKKAIEQRAKETIQVLKEKDMAKLAALIHPKKGVQFSPYSHINVSSDIKVMGSGLAALWVNTATTHWGEYDGSGDPIDLTFPDYWDKFVYNQDFAAAPQISYNVILGKGNMINNVFSIYPTSTFITVEYHFPGFDPQYQGMDWTSLRLVFENSGGSWYLVAIVHDQHTM